MENTIFSILTDDLYGYLFQYILRIEDLKIISLTSKQFSGNVFKFIKKIIGIKKCSTKYISQFPVLEELIYNEDTPEDTIIEEGLNDTYLPSNLRCCAILTESSICLPYFNFHRRDYKINIRFKDTFIVIRGDKYIAMRKGSDAANIKLYGLLQIKIPSGYLIPSKRYKELLIKAYNDMQRPGNRFPFHQHLVPHIEEINGKLSTFTFFKKDEIFKYSNFLHFCACALNELKLNISGGIHININDLNSMELNGDICSQLLPSVPYFDFENL